jgi:hypothetical protein
MRGVSNDGVEKHGKKTVRKRQWREGRSAVMALGEIRGN